MHFQRKYLFCTTILAGMVAVSAPAFAQDAADPIATAAPGAPSPQDATVVEEIVVTGSRIRRDPVNSPTPLIQVEREALLTTGQSTVIDYLATIPALAQSMIPSDTTGSLGIGGLALPNLRALGSGRTLTLVDGRRHVGSNGGSLAVDIDTIPRLMIENIEIVTGGAASVYGADAVSGVLNFVLRKDFEGLEIDANYGMINQDGEASKRISALIGHNFLDDRLNVYAHAEYEDLDEVQSLDMDWLRDATGLYGLDADPTSMPYDGLVDVGIQRGVRTLQRPRWGQTTLANAQLPSALNDPDVPFGSCTSITASNCFNVDPAYTWVFEGSGARLADFGQRVGQTGINRPNNIGGDGDNPATFGTITRVPESRSSRFQVGANFQVTSNIEAYVEAKYIDEDTKFSAQPVFYDFYINDSFAGGMQPAFATNAFNLSLSDNAYLPDNLRAAIRNNTFTQYAAPTADAPGQAVGTVAAPFARHTLFGNDRDQENNRQLQRYVVGLKGGWDQVGVVSNLNWDLSYTYGKVEVVNKEIATDNQRFQLASDAVFDTAGVLGSPGAIVCRATLLQASGADLADDFRGGDLRDSAEGQRAVDECQPLNVFGNGNQSTESLDYVSVGINVRERNEQEQAIASVSGQLWDFWGAGPIGAAVGAEYRREYTEAIGRDADTGDRFLFLNTGPDFPGAEYTSNEYFAELSLPLLRDSFLGEYAELSGSYRYADYSTVGNVDVYGVNLIYRPIRDITFKTSFNSSVRVPDLGENFSPLVQTFANGFVDPCATAAINSPTLDAETRTNRIANCTALASEQGLTFDFAGATDTNVDDYNPFGRGNGTYASGIAGVGGGNPDLNPEESESFTFSAVFQPRFIPNLSIILDYYEIEIDEVIASVTAQTQANNCVNGPTLNAEACSVIFRNDPDEPFAVGAPQGDPIGGFIEGSINYAQLSTRGLDFTARYRWDFDEMMGRNWGRLDYSIGGLWLLEQQSFFNAADPSDFDEDASLLTTGGSNPRVRFTSSLTYTPNDTWSVNWTADWQSAQDIVQLRDFVNNADSRPTYALDTGNFARHDFTVRWNVRDDLSLRAGVVNAFDDEQPDYLGTTLYSNFDPYGRRFFIGLNFRPF
jgi:outer membrane receptor protein involved in Fe transport